MNIQPNNLKRQYEQHADEYKQKAIEVLDSGWYVLGNEVAEFEREWANYIGTEHCIGVASGLDALIMAFRILGIEPGDEVIVCSNAYIACVMGITINGGTPVFVEPDEYDNIDADKIEEAITDRTKAILAVHLFGQCCDMDKICALGEKYDLAIVEDCAQAHGNTWKGRKAGSFGDIACFSFYPSKGCGAFGDGGAIVTNSDEFDKQARIIRNYGSEKRYHNSIVGMNSRLDELQAGLLRVKLTHLDDMNAERRELADAYSAGIDNPLVAKPSVRPGADSSWHQYVIHSKYRDQLKEHLERHGIGTLIHYPVPPHLSEAYEYLGYNAGDFPIAETNANEVLSLPIYNGMLPEEQEHVITTINSFRCGDEECITPPPQFVKPQFLTFAQYGDERGRMVVVEGAQDIPFEPKRVFYIYGTEEGVVRGQHANIESEFVLINVAGKSKVRTIDQDGNEEVFSLDEPHTGIYIPKMVWR